MDREDGFCPSLHLDRSTVSAKADRVPDRVSIHAERDDWPPAHEGSSCRQVSAPRLVGEILLRGDQDIGSVKPYCNITGHFICATYQWQAIAAVEVAVILHVVVHPT